jgi:flagella basal body P-ring formation protein FlgA
MQDARWNIMDDSRIERVNRLAGAVIMAVAMVMQSSAALADASSGSVNQALAAETEVHLYPTAVVADETVRLGDVARLSGATADLASQWPVANAPEPGGSVTFDLSHLRKALAQRDINLANWIFRGSNRCRITRPGATASEGTPEDTDTGNVRTPRSFVQKNGVAGSTSDASNREKDRPAARHRVDLDPDTLEAAIYRHVGSKLHGLGGEPTLRFSPTFTRLLSLARPLYEFRIIDRSDRLLGMISLEVSIYEQGQLTKTVPTIVDVSLTKKVVVAAAPINAGQIISREHVQLENRSFDRLEEIGSEDPNAFIGQRIKGRLIRPGEMLTARDVEPVPLISRNDEVIVHVNRGGLQIKMAAKAMSTGGYGEPVRLRHALSREMFTAIVIGPKTAELTGSQTSASGQRGAGSQVNAGRLPVRNMNASLQNEVGSEG